MPLLDLSNATKLKDVEFQLYELKVGWINTALHTATSKSLYQITLCFPNSSLLDIIPNLIKEGSCLEWQDLDHLLVQLWTIHSVCPVFTYEKMEGWIGSGVLVPKLLPELTSRGIVDAPEHRQRSEQESCWDTVF